MSQFIRYRTAVLLVVAIIASRSSSMADESPQATAFFEAKIRPVLVQHCYQCHSAKAGKSEGGLRLDSRNAIRTGGDRGAAVVPGELKKSVLLTAISHTDPDLKMPPKKERLPESVINDFKTWINSGATDPREEEAASPAAPPVTIEAGRQFWAFQKPTTHKAPPSKNPNWARRELDHFILAKLDESGLAPSADAEPATLLRRLHFDLVGLPPPPEAIVAFQKRIEGDGIDAALAAEVDVLLASPQFGERWGRHWLDVARFAESSGKEANISFPYAWRYRDYVID